MFCFPAVTRERVPIAVVRTVPSVKQVSQENRSTSTSAAKMPSVPDTTEQGFSAAAGRQSRAMSFVEAVANVVVGFLLALVTQIAIFPLFGLAVSVADNLLISIIFTAVSLLRSFALRRLFEALHAKAT